MVECRGELFLAGVVDLIHGSNGRSGFAGSAGRSSPGLVFSFSAETIFEGGFLSFTSKTANLLRLGLMTLHVSPTSKQAVQKAF